MRILRLSHYLPTLKGLAHNVINHEAVFPFYASFKLTSRCHFGCPFCNVKNDRAPDLTTAQVMAVLDNLSNSSVLMTSFEGGEPLLQEDIGELLQYARNHCRFYLLFTTSVKNVLDYPLEDYGRNIDFFHISIDEGHNNLELFDSLPALVRRVESQVSVQVVVTRHTVAALEDKVRRASLAGANVVIIPATHMDNTDDYFPDIAVVEKPPWPGSGRNIRPQSIHRAGTSVPTARAGVPPLPSSSRPTAGCIIRATSSGQKAPTSLPCRFQNGSCRTRQQPCATPCGTAKGTAGGTSTIRLIPTRQ